MCANKCLPINCICRKRKGFSLKLLKSDKQFQQSFSELGRNWELSNELFEQMEKFTCRMYAPKQQSVSVNKIRYQLFCAKSGDIESHQLPPCHVFTETHAVSKLPAWAVETVSVKQCSGSQSSWKRMDIGNGGQQWHPCHWLDACATSPWCGFRTSGLLLPKRVHYRKLRMSDQQPQMYRHVQIENLCKSPTQWWPSWSKYNWSRTSGYLNFKKSDLTRC